MKFGVAKSAASRRNQMQVGAMEKLKVIAETPAMPRHHAFELEWLVHRTLGKYHLRGEWFSICPKTLGVAQLLQAKTPKELLTYFCGAAEEAVAANVGQAVNFAELHRGVKAKLSWGVLKNFA